MLAALCLVTLSSQTTVIGILVIWGLFSLFLNGQYCSLSTSIPTQVLPAAQDRGKDLGRATCPG